ncbi:MAG: 50S ribosomal protein L25 [Actinobacteria bacterium]|nr:50S ribosomal protein L25 [Actinomycetota bacterium]
MSQTKLVATTGRATGSAASRRLRTEGNIPGVLYGHGMAPISVTVERRELRLALSGPAGANTVLDLQVDGKSYPAVVKEMQRHPVKRNVSHIDFLQVNMNEEITVSIPLRLEGESKAVMAENGLVDPAVDSIEVVTTPNNMPNEFVIDVSNMQPHEVIRLAPCWCCVAPPRKMPPRRLPRARARPRAMQRLPRAARLRPTPRSDHSLIHAD